MREGRGGVHVGVVLSEWTINLVREEESDGLRNLLENR